MRPLPPTSPTVSRYSRFIERHALAITMVFLATTALFALSLRRLELRTDFQDLLPDGQPSVVALQEIVKRVGGVGTLNVVIESSDKEASKRFAADLVTALRQKMRRELQTIDSTAEPARRFFRKNGLLYLSPDELREIDRTLGKAITKGKLEANPLYLDLDEKEGARKDPAAELRALEDRLRRRAAAVDRFPEGFYIGEKGRLLAIFLRPSGSSLDIGGARTVIGKVRGIVEELGPQRYHAGLKVSFTGSLQDTVNEHETIARDLLGTSWLCALLIGLAVWLYFRRLRVLALLTVTLAAGAIWAFGVAAIACGAINAQTAFLGSIIVGTGINYGIMILARYLEERRQGRSSSEALGTALRSCFRPTLVAALATAIAFGVLGVARTRSFAQFGLIGGLGIVLCWGLSYSALPALLVLCERVPWLRLRASPRRESRLAYPAWLARLPHRSPVTIVAVTVTLLAISAAAVLRHLPRSLETDARNLRNRSAASAATDALDDRVRAMMGDTLVPAVVLARGPEHARQICQSYDRLRSSQSRRPPIEWCRSIHSLLPDRQQEKLAVVAAIRRRLDTAPRELMPAEARSRIDELRAQLELRPLGLTDLPEELRERFRDRNGTEGALALVAPGRQLSFDRVDDLYAYADALREIRLEAGEVVQSSGEQVIFADILRTIGFDAPRTTALAAAGVLLMLVLVLRRAQAVALVGGSLVAGVGLMAGIAALLGIRYNFLNFVALPTTFGIGVDYSVNLHERQAQDGPGSMEGALRHTGPAVVVASLTTIIGYAVLLTSKSMVLTSFGQLAILGEVTCLAAALVLLPALHALAERRRASRLVAARLAPAARPSAPPLGAATSAGSLGQ